MSDESPNFERLNVSQLRESCERRGLSSTGLKKELISRLKEHAAAQAKEETKEEEMKEEESDVKEEIKEEVKEEMQTDEVEADGDAVEKEDVEEEKEEDKEKEEKEEKKSQEDKVSEEKKASNGLTPTDTLPDGKPKNLGRQKFAFGYMKMLSTKSVVIHPFKPDIFHNQVFVEYLEKAASYEIKNTSHSKTSGVMLEYMDVDMGDEAWREIHRALSGDEELTVEHPDFHADSTFWSHRVDTGIDWYLNLCVLKEMEIRDLFTKRVLLMENVPECTHAELVEEFPEARTLTYFGFDAESPGCVGVECFSTNKAEEFIEKYNGHEFKGEKVTVEWYNVRFNRFDKVVRRYRKEHPEITPPDQEPLNDEERIAKVKEYAALNEAKRTIGMSYEYSGSEKIKKCQELSETQVPIARHLFQDAKRRQESGLDIPEPPEEMTAMVKHLLEGKLEKRKERAQEGNKLAQAKEKYSKKQPQQQKKQPQAGKRPAGSGQNLSGYPPHKKFQDRSPGRAQSSRSSYGNRYSGMQQGFNRNMGGGMGLNERGILGNYNRGMGGGYNDNVGGGFNDNMGGGGGFSNRGMAHGMNMGMSGNMGGNMGSGMMMPNRMGGMGGGDMGMGMGGMEMGGISSVTKTVQALTDKVRELEMLTNRGGSGGMGGGAMSGRMGGGMGGGMGLMGSGMGGGMGGARGGNFDLEMRGHRGHKGRRW